MLPPNIIYLTFWVAFTSEDAILYPRFTRFTTAEDDHEAVPEDQQRPPPGPGGEDGLRSVPRFFLGMRWGWLKKWKKILGILRNASKFFLI
jgi:hypothetical protein